MSKLNKAPLIGLVAMVLASSAAVAGKPVPVASMSGSYLMDGAGSVSASISGQGLPCVKVKGQCAPIAVSLDVSSFSVASRYMCELSTTKGRRTTISYAAPSNQQNSAAVEASANTSVAIEATLGGFSWLGDKQLVPEVVLDCSEFAGFAQGATTTVLGSVLCEITASEASAVATYETTSGNTTVVNTLNATIAGSSMNLCNGN